ncbi:hypothetical protein D1007_60016 [Hordeum vulgare]|nr:hypothetical protein D1007_60016 [Hordeum vulgare]
MPSLSSNLKPSLPLLSSSIIVTARRSHDERRVRFPSLPRWTFFHHGKVRFGMSGWLMSLAREVIDVPMAVEEFGTAPVSFEEAAVFRRLLLGISMERLRAIGVANERARIYGKTDFKS